MPVIARFFGMVVKMFFLGKEHGVAHIHVIYGEYAGVIDVATGDMLEDDLPQRALGMVREWVSLHRAELMEMWDTKNIRALPPLE